MTILNTSFCENLWCAASKMEKEKSCAPTAVERKEKSRHNNWDGAPGTRIRRFCRLPARLAPGPTVAAERRGMGYSVGVLLLLLAKVCSVDMDQV